MHFKVAALAAVLLASLAQAQSYPTKPVRIIVPYAAGGNTDFTARAVAEKLSSQLSVVTQRLQRLESMIDLQGAWTPSAETIAATNKFRVTPPPVFSPPPNMTPIAARPTVRTPGDPPQSGNQPLPPGNGNYRP